MKAVQVDPRDIEWEQDLPVYRVYFWRRGEHPSVSASETGWACDEWQVTEAGDVLEVVAWARDRADGDFFEVFIQTRDGGSLGLLRLLGDNPTGTDDKVVD